MCNYKLVKPDEELKAQYLAYLKDWDDHAHEELVPFACGLGGKSYEEWLAETRELELRVPKPEWVTATLYLLQDEQGEEILGMLHIRHTLNEELAAHGGHIGYGVKPSARGRGLAKVMLSLGLEKAKQVHGLGRVLVTCDKDNAASAATIRRCGGVLENEIVHGGKAVQRYWVDTE